MAWWTFVLAAAATAVAGYILARGFVMPGAALLGPMWFTAYIGRAAHAGGFLFTEFWGGFAAVFAIALMARRRWTAAAVAVIAAVALRELMAYLLLVFLATALASEERREPLRGLVTAFVGSAVVLGLHFYRAPVTAGVADISAWLHGGIVPLLAAVRFSNDHMTVGVYPYLALVLALAGAWLTRESRQRALLVAAVAVPLILLATVSAGVWGYYWGPILMVPVLMIAPTALNRVWPAVAPAPDSRHHVRHPEKDSR